MRKVKSQITYTVPSWNFCNSDNLLPGGHLRKHNCRFCIKTKAGYNCALYEKPLRTDGEFIGKLDECCRATAGYPSVIDEAPPVPTVDPKELMAQTINLYTQTVHELLKQGYPRNIAEIVAKKHLLGK